jgi:hypothetical protein
MRGDFHHSDWSRLAHPIDRGDNVEADFLFGVFTPKTLAP